MIVFFSTLEIKKYTKTHSEFFCSFIYVDQKTQRAYNTSTDSYKGKALAKLPPTIMKNIFVSRRPPPLPAPPSLEQLNVCISEIYDVSSFDFEVHTSEVEVEAETIPLAKANTYQWSSSLDKRVQLAIAGGKYLEPNDAQNWTLLKEDLQFHGSKAVLKARWMNHLRPNICNKEMSSEEVNTMKILRDQGLGRTKIANRLSTSMRIRTQSRVQQFLTRYDAEKKRAASFSSTSSRPSKKQKVTKVTKVTKVKTKLQTPPDHQFQNKLLRSLGLTPTKSTTDQRSNFKREHTTLKALEQKDESAKAVEQFLLKEESNQMRQHNYYSSPDRSSSFSSSSSRPLSSQSRFIMYSL